MVIAKYRTAPGGTRAFSASATRVATSLPDLSSRLRRIGGAATGSSRTLRTAPVTDHTGRPPCSIGFDFTPSSTRPMVFTGNPMAAKIGAVPGNMPATCWRKITIAPPATTRAASTPAAIATPTGVFAFAFFSGSALRTGVTGAATNSMSSSGGASGGGRSSKTRSSSGASFSGSWRS
jgi:hypothetical protein